MAMGSDGRNQSSLDDTINPHDARHNKIEEDAFDLDFIAKTTELHETQSSGFANNRHFNTDVNTLMRTIPMKSKRSS